MYSEETNTAKDLAPIVLFVYNRPDHTEQTIEALKKNLLAQDSELFIFSDGAKAGSEEKVAEVRNYIKTINGFKKVEIIESETNKGLAASVIAGVTKIVNEYGKIIVLEDDLITSPYFLKYMNDSLNIYKDDERVACITGYTYPIENLPETFFIKGADCWSWATWKRAWNVFNPDAKDLLKQFSSKQKREFDFNNTYPFLQMLKDHIDGHVNSWAIRWNASAFLKDMLCLYPGQALAKNIGLDSSGTHDDGEFQGLNVEIWNKPISEQKLPIEENAECRKQFENFFKKTFKNKNTFFLTRTKRGNKRHITLLGHIKFSYEKKDPKIIALAKDKQSLNPKKFPICMTKKEKSLLLKYLKKSKNLLEFGAGGSTFLTTLYSDAKLISVESDANWIKFISEWKILQNAIESGKLTFHHIDIGAIGDWGYPANESKKDSWSNYSTEIFNIIDKNIIDTVFIDGRFRVACTASTILNVKTETTILIHDFWTRPEYHVVLEFLETIAKVDNLGIFKIKENIDKNKLKNLFEEYKLNSD